jgi:hypothetical protein
VLVLCLAQCTRGVVCDIVGPAGWQCVLQTPLLVVFVGVDLLLVRDQVCPYYHRLRCLQCTLLACRPHDVAANACVNID